MSSSAQPPLVVCSRSDDPLASKTKLDVQDIANRIKVLRDPEFHHAAHARLIEMFEESGIAVHSEYSASTPADVQWMVKAGYGLALIDQAIPLDNGLTSRTIAGINWTADPAFIHHSRVDHIALPFIECSLSQNWREAQKEPNSCST